MGHTNFNLVCGVKGCVLITIHAVLSLRLFNKAMTHLVVWKKKLCQYSQVLLH